uniref:Uncharacterized protein n=1 Tax=Anguilla anguilla TaxID=7936 RepID=A0A0E9U2E1_ANGAN
MCIGYFDASYPSVNVQSHTICVYWTFAAISQVLLSRAT